MDKRTVEQTDGRTGGQADVSILKLSRSQKRVLCVVVC